MHSKKENIILGIDPGTNILGYGVIATKGNAMRLINLGVVKLDLLKEQPEKLRRIYEKVTHLIKHYHPDEVAVEAPFYGKNVQSMLKLGRAQGVAMLAATMRDLKTYEYAPKRIKQAITGNGNASKEQVAAMLKQLLNYKQDASYLDATDALAAAVCHSFQANNPLGKENNYKDWAAFIAANPDKLK